MIFLMLEGIIVIKKNRFLFINSFTRKQNGKLGYNIQVKENLVKQLSRIEIFGEKKKKTQNE